MLCPSQPNHPLPHQTFPAFPRSQPNKSTLSAFRERPPGRSFGLGSFALAGEDLLFGVGGGASVRADADVRGVLLVSGARDRSDSQICSRRFLKTFRREVENREVLSGVRLTRNNGCPHPSVYTTPKSKAHPGGRNLFWTRGMTRGWN